MNDLQDTLLPTPAQVEGPFYPVRYRKQEGNKLNKAEGGLAHGELITVTGHIRDIQGNPLNNVLVEIWQADNNGKYDHPGDKNHPNHNDPNFQYWGKTVVDSSGRYLFETIKPAPYNDEGDWRTSHIHFKIYINRNVCALTTQMYFAGEQLNEQDNHLGALPAEQQQLLLTAPKKNGEKYGLPDKTEIHEFNITLDLSANNP